MVQRTALLLAVSFSLWVCIAGCAPAPPMADAADAAKGPAGGGAVIGHLVTPDRIITIYSGGPRFSIETLDGRAIDGLLTIDGLQASDPKAASIFRTGIVGDGDLLDASLWPPPGHEQDGIEIQVQASAVSLPR